MQSKSDAQLLRDYAERGAEAAFSELVRRHTNLVYSATLRQVESPDTAAEIAQGVFLGLARGARSLAPRFAPEASLAGWLCRSARNLSLNHRREEFRRQSREKHVMEQLLATPDEAPDWERLRPVLDDAMSELSETDYDALVLRFYQNRDFRAIGAAIGVSDDTAQKRVSRALEKLRDLLAQRGIRATAAALGMVITANAVQSAPVCLANGITSAIAGASLTSSSASTAITKTIAMTAFQKLLVTAAVTVGIVTPVLVLHSDQSKLGAQEQALQHQSSRLANLVHGNAHLADLVANAGKSNSLTAGDELKLLQLRGQIARLNMDIHQLTQVPPLSTPANQTGTNSLDSLKQIWSRRADQLKQWLEQNPSGKIPELRLVRDQTWIDAVYGSNLENDDEYRRAMGNVRVNAENEALDIMLGGLQKYAAANGGQFPTELSQLSPYFRTLLGDDILNRYEIVPSSSLVSQLQSGDSMVITEKAPVDTDWDCRTTMGLTGGHIADERVTNRWQQNP